MMLSKAWAHRVIHTRAVPRPRNPSFRAAAFDTSITRPRTCGPRSTIRTVTLRPLRRSVTRTRLPNGRVRCAAIMAFGSNFTPLAVRLPANLSPYHDALPHSCAIAPPDAAATASATNTIHPPARMLISPSKFCSLSRSRSCYFVMPVLDTCIQSSEQRSLLAGLPGQARQRRCGMSDRGEMRQKMNPSRIGSNTAVARAFSPIASPENAPAISLT